MERDLLDEHVRTRTWLVPASGQQPAGVLQLLSQVVDRVPGYLRPLPSLIRHVSRSASDPSRWRFSRLCPAGFRHGAFFAVFLFTRCDLHRLVAAVEKGDQVLLADADQALT